MGCRRGDLGRFSNDCEAALGELTAVSECAHLNGAGHAGQIRLGLQMPPVAGILLDIFTEWRRLRPEISLRLFEMHDQGIRLALAERRIDAAIIARPSQWPGATGLEIYRERFIAAVPVGHPLTRRAALRWNDLQAEILLTQGWEDSQTARELYTSLIGGGLTFVTHSTGKEAIFVPSRPVMASRLRWKAKRRSVRRASFSGRYLSRTRGWTFTWCGQSTPRMLPWAALLLSFGTERASPTTPSYSLTGLYQSDMLRLTDVPTRTMQFDR
jgi:DNA-binding transcriptional LysR family regulator